MERSLASKAGAALFESVARMTGESSKRIIASQLGESPQGLSDVLGGHRGSLDRVVGWLGHWNERHPSQALVMEIGVVDDVRVVPAALHDYFELRPTPGSASYELFVRTAPDRLRPGPGLFGSADLSSVPREHLLTAWSSARLEPPSSIERVLEQAQRIDWEGACQGGTGPITLRWPSGEREWQGRWWLAPRRNVAALRIEAPGAGAGEMEKASDDFMLHIGSATVFTRDVTIARMGPDECIVVIRPAPFGRDLLEAITNRRGATVFRLDP